MTNSTQARTLTIISGFARSGKTTLNDHLMAKGVPCSSSSDILSIDTLTFFNVPVTTENLLVLSNKETDKWIELKRQYQLYPLVRDTTDCRDDKIFVAEQVLVPTYGRQYFALRCLSEVIDSNSPLSAVFSTVREERMILIQEAKASGKFTHIVGVNIEAEDDERGVDYRSLIADDEGLDVRTIFNRKRGAEELYTHYLNTLPNNQTNLPF